MAKKKSSAVVPYRGGNVNSLENLRNGLEKFINSDFFSLPSFDGDIFEPSVDMWDDKKNVYVETEMPGMEPKDIEIRITGNNNLQISACTERHREEKNKKFYRNERYRGDYYREVSLPEPVVGGKAKAEYKNGLLDITIPKNGNGMKEKAVSIKVHG